jgi:hypothetical protein
MRSRLPPFLCKFSKSRPCGLSKIGSSFCIHRSVAPTRVTPTWATPGTSTEADSAGFLRKGGDPAAGSPTATLLRLHPNHRTDRWRLSPLRVESTTSGPSNFRGVTGGVYKARERIHRGVLIRDY